MKTLRVDSCFKTGVDSHCVILLADEGTFFVPLVMDGYWGDMVYKMFTGSGVDESDFLGIETATSIMQQTDVSMLFAELEYNEDINVCEAHLAGYRSNEIGKKFYTIDLPLPYVLIMTAREAAIQIVMDEGSIEAAGKRDSLELESYISEHNIE